MSEPVYEGMVATIRIGGGGLMSDENSNMIPDTHLLKANNISIQDGIVQKESGSRRWNLSALSSGIVALIDFFPQEHLQRFIALTRTGKIYKYSDPETQTEITALGTAPSSLIVTDSSSIVEGGSELASSSRKLFIFTGNSQIQVINADGNTRTNISNPAADWISGNFPKCGAIHQNRLWVASGHRIYASDPANHENFSTNGTQYLVYPGQGEEFLDLKVYKGRLFGYKYPRGVYMLEDTDVDFVNWFWRQISSEFGIAGVDCAVEALDDYLIANSSGSVTSFSAVQRFGDIESSNIFGILKIDNFIRTQMNQTVTKTRRGIYYEEKKLIYFAAQSSGGIQNDRLIAVDFSRSRPEVVLMDKDQANCFCIRRVMNGKKPFYGSEDGFIYEMDRSDRNVANIGYEGRFQTPHQNFAELDPRLAGSNKIFDMIEFEFYPCGRWDLNFQYFIDGVFKEARTVKMSKGPALGDFILNKDRLSGNTPVKIRKKLKGAGSTFSLECWNSIVNQNFKLIAVRIYFRPTNLNEKDKNSGRS